MKYLLFYFFAILTVTQSHAQLPGDSALRAIGSVSGKYLREIDNKINTYTNRVNSKTVKTLEKLSRWEAKIRKTLTKTNPRLAERLFANEKASFGYLLQQVKQGNEIANGYKAKYDRYRDQMDINVNFLSQPQVKGKLDSSKLAGTISRLDELSKQEDRNEYIAEFIKTRRKELINEAISSIGKSKYLRQINKQGYYYLETVRNAKDIFSNSKRTEELVSSLLNKIPGFEKFSGQNSGIAGVFQPTPSFDVLAAGIRVPVVNGLMPRMAVQQYISSTVSSKQALSIVNGLAQQGTNFTQMNDSPEKTRKELGFTPNSQRSKPFFKRFEKGADIQFAKTHQFLPASASMALKLGYKLNDRSSVGIGLSYILGLGNGWKHIALSNQGIGLRSYISWLWKKGLYIQGGSEWNYMMKFKNIAELKDKDAWQQSALIGLSKKYAITKRMKGNIQVLYNLLHAAVQPRTQAIVVRFGYEF